MRTIPFLLAGALLAACSGSGNNNHGDGSTHDSGGDGSVSNPDGSMSSGGTCDAPIDLATAGMMSGNSIVFNGTTDGAPNNLHPYGGCVAIDAGEVVFRFTVPQNVQALKITTEGSMFDTVLYARTDCSQDASGMGMDLSCNDDNFDHFPTSTIFLTTVSAGDTIFIVVDGSAPMGSDMPSSGPFTLTITQVPFGTMGNPCRPMVDGSTDPRCDTGLACSSFGGAPDGTPLCVPPVPLGGNCDPRGFENTCTGDMVTCAADPSPPDGQTPQPVCATPGTHLGTPCRETEPRCDAPAVCGRGDGAICVRVLNPGDSCDLQGFSNACPAGTTCRPTDDAGAASCL